jgi:hypothetical protein
VEQQDGCRLEAGKPCFVRLAPRLARCIETCSEDRICFGLCPGRCQSEWKQVRGSAPSTAGCCLEIQIAACFPDWEELRCNKLELPTSISSCQLVGPGVRVPARVAKPWQAPGQSHPCSGRRVRLKFPCKALSGQGSLETAGAVERHRHRKFSSKGRFQLPPKDCAHGMGYYYGPPRLLISSQTYAWPRRQERGGRTASDITAQGEAGLAARNPHRPTASRSRFREAPELAIALCKHGHPWRVQSASNPPRLTLADAQPRSEQERLNGRGRTSFPKKSPPGSLVV